MFCLNVVVSSVRLKPVSFRKQFSQLARSSTLFFVYELGWAF